MIGCLSLLCCLNRLRGGALCSFGKEILNQKRQIFTDIFSRVDKLNKLKEHTVSNCATCLFSYGHISNKHFWISIIIWLCCKQHLFLSLNVFWKKTSCQSDGHPLSRITATSARWKKTPNPMWEDLLAWSVKLHNAPICSRGSDSCVIIFPTTLIISSPLEWQSSSSHLVTLQVIGWKVTRDRHRWHPQFSMITFKLKPHCF